ncbi:hypothetical protein [Sphingobacterium bovistauri]|uniref:AsmA-like C-terminal region n=1 Tax=Sphingobacterium bovistauri TaxID=2781959 RepID=A0ABS7Z6S3_9SPHI|nr:hypothetical protein [Sphingobacterium bovistauri]MCA5005886.1 hypothetical protein [Sphingobacterium bovistauri]
MRPIWKWILGIIAAIIVILISVVWYYSRNWKPIVETKLKEVVYNSTNGLYSLRYDDLDLNIGLGNVTLTNAELIPDSVVYQKMILSKDAPNNRFHIKLKALKVRRFNLMDVISKKKLNIKSISFEEPNIHLLSEHHSFNDTISNKPKKTLYENVKDIFSSVNVKDINIEDVKFKYSKFEEGKQSSIDLDKITIKVHDVLVDETSLQDSTRFFYTKMVDVDIPGFEYDLPDGFYKAKFKGLKINTRDQNILLTDVVYQPKMNKASFYKQKNQNVTMAVMKFDTLRVERLDFKALIDNQQTIASKVQLKNGTVDLYADKRYPKYPIVKVGRSPHQQIMKMKKLLHLDTVVVDNISITYHEMSGKFFREGSISFNNANGVLTNVTNDSLALKKDKYMRADLRAKIMNAGNIHMKFGFDMLSKTGHHTYSGTLGAMQATSFNRILAPLLNVELASGNIKKISFNMEGTDRKNWGEFRFDYSDLKISLLNKRDENGEQSSKKVVSYLVNHLLINDSNPDNKGVYTIGKINYTRVPEHTFFKTVWQSLLDGIKQCAGISKEREAKLMGTAETGKDVVEKGKHIVEGAKDVGKKTGNFIKGIFKKDKKSEEDSKQ